MRTISSQILVPAAILAIVFTTAGRAEETSPVTVSQQELQGKIAYCKTCHGLSGQGFRGALYRCRDSRGSNPNILKISCGPSMSAGGQTQLCLTSRTS